MCSSCNLKPCEVCGELTAGLWPFAGGLWKVKCKCGWGGPVAVTPEEAEEMWNAQEGS